MDDGSLRALYLRKGCPFLNTQQAAHYLGLSYKTLEKYRVTGGGPRFRRHGRHIVYHIDDLDAWSAARAQYSTSETVAHV